ncbi:DUF6879 family protein [Catenuloplanes japonicus]|uniref:DUF6879 family protein n=1 Tax=Catenuloplanes japonicus TaxID=33876 RepID=UPI00068AFD12|nr:DUF6879 family protein [Catenuloplanes japonicus]
MIENTTDDREKLPVGLLRKVGTTTLTAGIAYVITSLVDKPNIAGFTLSVLIGGITLIVQFLNDFENRLQKVETHQRDHTQHVEDLVETRFHKLNEATELFRLVETSTMRPDEVTTLVRHSTLIGPTTPPLVQSLASAQIRRTSNLLRELSEKADAIYEGEDREWLLCLTEDSTVGIDAVSLMTVDSGSKGVFEGGGLWTSDLGQRYLDAQRQAVKRGVTVRRIMVLDQPTGEDDEELRHLSDLHRAAGIEARVLEPRAVPGTLRNALLDFIVFDGSLSYETTRASSVDHSAKAIIATTRLVMRPDRVRDRIRWFDDLWDSAREMP